MRVTFAEAIARAQEKNPTVAAAAAGILRAEGLIRQARAATLFQLSGNVTTTTLNTSIEFAGQTVTPQNSLDRVADGEHADRGRRGVGAAGAGARTRAASPS